MKPLFARLLQNRLPSRDLAQFSGSTGINVHTLRAYRSGTRVPPIDAATKIAALLFEDPDEAAGFLAAVQDAHPGRSQLETLSGHQSSLKVSTIEFAAVSQLLSQPDGAPAFHPDSSQAEGPNLMATPDAMGFVDTLFLRFLRLSGVHWESLKRSFSADVREQLWKGDIDVALSYFTSIDRALLVRFWILPIRVTIGALCHSDFSHPDYIQKIQAALRYRTGGQPDPRVLPVVLRGSVSQIHCETTLGYSEANRTMKCVERRDFMHFHKAYQALRAEHDDRIPVIVHDELSIAEMLAARDASGQPFFPDYFPALPLTSSVSAGVDDFKRESPIYFVGIACSRRNDTLWNFLDEALRTLLLSEIHTTSQAYCALYFALLETLKNALKSYMSVPGFLASPPRSHVQREAIVFARAHQWVLHTLHLTAAATDQFTEAYPHWRSILVRSRQLVFESLADRNEITHVVQSAIQSHGIRHGDAAAIRHVEEALDFDLAMEAPARRHAALSPDGFCEIVTRRLKGDRRDPDLKLDIFSYDAANPVKEPLLAGVKGLLHSYRWSRSKVAASDRFMTQFTDVMGDPNHFLRQNDALCLIATLREAHNRVFAVVFVVPDKERTGERELRYLWVDWQYRGMGVGQQIVNRALAEAELAISDKLSVNIPRAAGEKVVRYFRARGFEEQPPEELGFKRMVRTIRTS